MIRINLAPPPEKRRSPSAVSVRTGVNLGFVFGGLFALLAVMVGAYWWSVSSDLVRLQREVEANEKEKARLQKVIADGQRFRQETEELERRVNAIESVARNQPRPTYLMDAIADMVTADLWLTRIEEKGQQLKLAGITYSSNALSDFMANLKMSGKFKDVDLVESRQDLAKSPRVITFEVSCRFEA